MDTCPECDGTGADPDCDGQGCTGCDPTTGNCPACAGTGNDVRRYLQQRRA